MRDEKGKFLKGCKRPDHAESQKGNSHGTKLKNPSIRKEAFKQYCDWIASGKSKEGWCFEHPEFSVTFRTLEKYIKDNPNEFPPLQKEQAETKSYQVWEQRGYEMMIGNIKGCQPAIYQMFMRNKFGWDKESRVTHSVEPEAKKIFEEWRKED